MCINNRLLTKINWKFLFYTVFILTASLGQLSRLYAQKLQDVQLNIHVRNASLKQVVAVIEAQTQYTFIYADNAVNVSETISIDENQKGLNEILDLLKQHFNIDYSVKDNLISVKRKDVRTPENKTAKLVIQGIVRDDLGEILIGVQVRLDGTSTGTTTDVNGHYAIAAESGQTLRFTYLGQKEMVITVGSNETIDVQMESNLQELSEIVVTALGIEKDTREVGYATQQVEGGTLQTVKGIDVGTSLTGKVAGLLVKNSTEFAEAPEIQLRGETPLLVIDGVPYGNMSLRDIPADNIERIDVLKGATASALYGYRGAAGAIMVTTVKGASKKGVSVTVNSSTMFTAGYLAIPEMQSTYGRKVDATNTYFGTGSWGVPLQGQLVRQWDPVSKGFKEMPYSAIGKNNFKNYLEQGFILNNSVSVAQQGEYGNIRSSVTWVENKGQYPNSRFDKLTYSLAGDINLNKFKLSSSVAYNKQKSPNIGFSGYKGYDPMYQILVWSSPDYDIRQYKDYWLEKNQTQNNSYTATNNNPYFDRYERIHSVDRDIFNGFVSARYDFAPWLQATVRTGFDTYSDHQIVRISQGSLQGAGVSTVIRNGTEIWGESQKGSYNTGLGRGYSINSDFLLSGSKTFGDFGIDALIGSTLFHTEDQGIEARTQGGLSIPGYYSLKSSVNPAVVNSSLYRRQVNSLYGKATLSWKSLLYVDGTLRNDWSSTLSASSRSYLYPSVSTSLVVSELFNAPQWLSLWKLRSSWTSSKTPAGVYDINSVYSIANNAWAGLTSATYPTTIRGSNVRPESSQTYEVGTEARFLRDRLSVDLTYYSKRMYDFLRSTEVSAATGFAANYINTQEEITRTGVELAMQASVVKSSIWSWNVGANWSKYARYYTKLDPQFSADQPWVKVGKRADHFTLNDFQKDQNGNIIYQNGLPIYSNYNSLYGYSDPNWIWGVNTTVKRNNISLSVALDGRVGGIAQTTTEMYMWRAGNHPNSINDARYKDATVGGTNYVGDGVMVVSGAATYDQYGNITSDSRVFEKNNKAVTYENYINAVHKGTAWGGNPSPVDAYTTTFFKIREVSLTYNFPKAWTTLIGAGSGSFSLVGQNLFLWSKQFKYSDPDGGTDNFSDPSQRYVGCNLKVSF